MRMLEKVARVIALTSGCNYDDDTVYNDKDEWLQQARAVIETMREPTDKMIKVSWPYNDKSWKATIDVILNEE